MPSAAARTTEQPGAPRRPGRTATPPSPPQQHSTPALRLQCSSKKVRSELPVEVLPQYDPEMQQLLLPLLRQVGRGLPTFQAAKPAKSFQEQR